MWTGETPTQVKRCPGLVGSKYSVNQIILYTDRTPSEKSCILPHLQVVAGQRIQRSGPQPRPVRFSHIRWENFEVVGISRLLWFRLELCENTWYAMDRLYKNSWLCHCPPVPP